MGWILLLWGLKTILFAEGLSKGIILIVMGLFFIVDSESINDNMKSDEDESSIDRSESILDEIGGADNIDINLSQYCEESQLVVLKDKRIHIGYNNYETKKIIDFDSIIELEIAVNNATQGSSHERSNNIIKDIIESIIVYIHTDKSTEELIFKYLAYDSTYSQENYCEILKGVRRLKAMIGDNSDVGNTTKTNLVEDTQHSIPDQIKKYKELLDMNAITEDEFDTKKKELLNA